MLRVWTSARCRPSCVSLGTTEIFLTDVRLPPANLIGEVGKGWEYIGAHLEWERLGLATSYVGNARTALDDTIKYTKERIAFGKPLSSLQVLKHRMAEDEPRSPRPACWSSTPHRR